MARTTKEETHRRRITFFPPLLPDKLKSPVKTWNSFGMEAQPTLYTASERPTPDESLHTLYIFQILPEKAIWRPLGHCYILIWGENPDGYSEDMTKASARLRTLARPPRLCCYLWDVTASAHLNSYTHANDGGIYEVKNWADFEPQSVHLPHFIQPKHISAFCLASRGTKSSHFPTAGRAKQTAAATTK